MDSMLTQSLLKPSFVEKGVDIQHVYNHFPDIYFESENILGADLVRRSTGMQRTVFLFDFTWLYKTF